MATVAVVEDAWAAVMVEGIKCKGGRQGREEEEIKILSHT